MKLNPFLVKLSLSTSLVDACPFSSPPSKPCGSSWCLKEAAFPSLTFKISFSSRGKVCSAFSSLILFSDFEEVSSTLSLLGTSMSKVSSLDSFLVPISIFSTLTGSSWTIFTLISSFFEPSSCRYSSMPTSMESKVDCFDKSVVSAGFEELRLLLFVVFFFLFFFLLVIGLLPTSIPVDSLIGGTFSVPSATLLVEVSLITTLTSIGICVGDSVASFIVSVAISITSSFLSKS